MNLCRSRNLKHSFMGMSVFIALASTPVYGKEVLVKIGHIAPLSGPQAHYGKDNESGARLAIDDLNKMKIQLDGGTAKITDCP